MQCEDLVPAQPHRKQIPSAHAVARVAFNAKKEATKKEVTVETFPARKRNGRKHPVKGFPLNEFPGNTKILRAIQYRGIDETGKPSTWDISFYPELAQMREAARQDAV
jgi:hypothetical protein